MRAPTQLSQAKPAGMGWAHCEVGRYLAAMQYFGSIGNPANEPLDSIVVDSIREKTWTAGTTTTTDELAVRSWRVDSTVREVQRIVEQEAIEPLQPGAIERDGVNRTLLKLAIRMTQMGFDDRVYMIDAGYSLDFWAQSVAVQWVSPTGVQELGRLGAEPNVETVDDIVIDGLLGVQILAIETPFGVSAPLTFYRAIEAESVLTLPIPRGARDVTIYQSAAGPASVEWTWSYGDPASFAPVWALGQVPFITGLRRTPTISVVPGATHIVSDVALLQDRFFTVVWTIQP
jgi:hypothetical protein